jgi:phosphopantothenoylcysteine synthetase/decarboxylase
MSPKLHPKSDVLVGATMTANSVAKLALGIADNQALTVLRECVATVPMIVFPRVNDAHARQPAWNDHHDRLRSAGVDLVYGEHVSPLAEARAAGPRELPSAAILSALKQHI